MPHLLGDNQWGNLPSLLDLIPFKTVLDFFHTVLSGKVIYLFFTDQIAPAGILYTGVMMALAMCLFSAAYVVNQSVQAAINWSSAFSEYAFTYRNTSLFGNALGIFELVGIGFFQLWSIALTITSLIVAGSLWTQMDQRMVGVKTEGKGGVALDEMEALKFFTLSMIIGLTAVIGGYSLGDTANELITWFDQYADDTDKEGQEKKHPYGRDISGTSAMHDVIFHYVVLFFGYTLFSVITFGSHILFWRTTFNDEVACKFDNFIDESALDQVRAIFPTVTSLDHCYEVMPGILDLLDQNKNGWLDRCEDANILVHIFGNSEAYGRKYSHFLPHAAAYWRCEQLFNPLY